MFRSGWTLSALEGVVSVSEAPLVVTTGALVGSERCTASPLVGGRIGASLPGIGRAALEVEEVLEGVWDMTRW